LSAGRAHSCTPPISISPLCALALWPARPSTVLCLLNQVCALGFTIKIVDADVAFTQGLGTFIMSAAQQLFIYFRRRRA